MAAAYAFSKAPDRFDVTLLERSSYCGGMATSVEIDPEVYGASYMNDGVQGETSFTVFLVGPDRVDDRRCHCPSSCCFFSVH